MTKRRAKEIYKVENLKDKKFRRYSKCNIPTKYIQNSLEDFKILGKTEKEKKQNQKSFDMFMDYYNNVETYLREGTGLLICGSVGIAKTFLLTQLAKKIIEVFDEENKKIQNEDMGDNVKFNKFYYIQATTISQMIFTSGLNEDELKIRRGIKTISGLWIDDISKLSETKSGFEISFLDDILRYRDLNCLSTFYTSQLPFNSIGEFKGLDEAISRPIHDIIRGNTIVINFRGESQR